MNEKRRRKATDDTSETMPVRELTRAELEIMQILWDRGAGFVNDIVAAMPEPRPAYNTVSTVVRILEKKGFVSHRPLGRTFEYFPVVGREEYTSRFMNSVLGNFFENSVSRMLSFFAEERRLSLQEMDEIIRIMTDAGREKQNERKR